MFDVASQPLSRESANPLPGQFSVFCDESSTRNNRFLVIGGIWCPRSLENRFRTRLLAVKEQQRIWGEAKWGKVSSSYLDKYKAVVRVFFEFPEVFFRCIVIDKTIVNYRVYHNNDQILAFNKFYFYLLSRNTSADLSYWIYPDHQTDRQNDPFPELQEIVNNYHWGISRKRPIRQIEPRSSHNEVIIQLADVFVGAVQGAWNQEIFRSAKIELCDFIAAEARLPSLGAGTPKWVTPVNIWQWRPRAQDQMLVSSLHQRPRL